MTDREGPRRRNATANEDFLKDIPHERTEPRPDFSQQPLKPSKLPASLQADIDDDAKYWDIISEGRAQESTESNVRYAAYASRFRTILLSAHRYVAYTSDIGESFRPIAHPYLVKGAYGISWAYLFGDVAHEGYKAYLANDRTRNPEKLEDRLPAGSENDKTVQAKSSTIGPGMTEGTRDALVKATPGHVPAIEDYRAVMAQRAVFQSIASMGLPAFTIHSIVRYSGQGLKNAKNATIRTWGPIGLGLAAVPFLPFAFDKPVEHVVETIFHKGFELIGGPDAVGHKPIHGQSEIIRQKNEIAAVREKEL